MSRADRIALLCVAALALGTALRLASPSLGGETAAPRIDGPEEARPNFDEVALRNPFSPSRPAGGGSVDQLGGAELVGILLSGKNRAALVRLADGTTKTIPPGGAVAGWTLVSLDKNQAILRRDAASTTLTLTRTAP